MFFENIVWLACLISSLSFTNAELCLCDTSLACDIVCSCDPDCSTEDKMRFTRETSVETSQQPDVTCVSSSIFSRITPDSSFSFIRVKDDNCFTSTKLSISSSSTKSTRAESSSIEAQNTLVPVTYTSSFRDIKSKNEAIMKANDLIFIRDELISRPLTLPAGLRGQCVQDSVLFLRNSSASCSLKVTENICKAGSKIDSLGSMFKELKIVKNFKISVNETITVTASCIDKDGVPLDSCLAPVENGGTCENVVKKVELLVTYEKEEISPEISEEDNEEIIPEIITEIVPTISLGITSAVIKITLDSVEIDSTSPLVTTVRFDGNSQDYPNIGPRFQRYKLGYELLFNISKSKVPFSPFQDDAACTTSRLTFPSSSIQNCAKKITDFSTTDFTELTKGLFSPLPSALAKYHNSDLANPDEWFQLTWDIPEVVESSATPMNLILTVTHRSYGNKLNPENEILSAATSITTTNLDSLNKEALVNDKLVFYFTTRFVSVDVESSKENNIISKLTRSLTHYFSFQKDSFPLQLLAVAVIIFVLLTLGILVTDQGKPQF